MVGPSKILTVSYGTFSCTLEGFEDPFSTMRGIAEYFRDLAADDRYFGAEPPTPDAEMLHKIAEREVNRRVEAQLKDDGIVLRQVEDRTAAPAPATPAAQEMAGDETDGDDGEGDGGNMFADIAQPSADQTSLSAKLSRIRAVVGSGTAGAAATAAFTGSIDAAFADIEPEEEAVSLGAVDLELGGDEPEARYADHEDEAAEPVTDVTEEAAPEAPAWDIGEPAPAPEAEPEEAHASEAEYREETPVHPSETEMETAAEAAEVEDLAAFDGASEEEVAEAWAEDEAALAEGFGVAGEETAAEQTVEPGWDAVAETPADEGPKGWDDEGEDDYEDEDDLTAEAEEDEDEDELETEVPVAETAPEDLPASEAETASVAAAETDEGHLGIAARIIKLKRAAMELSGKPQIEETPIPSVEMVAEAPTDAEMSDDEDDDSLFDDETFEPAEARSDDDTEQEDDDLDFDDEDDFDDFDEDDEDEDDRAEAVRDEAERSMLAAIAAATRQSTAGAADRNGDKDGDAPERSAETRPKSVAFTPEVTGEASEESFDRILEQTNTRMDESEGSRRRTAIAHLKAAVAATKADRFLKRRSDHSEEQSQYRNDLAQVVRPQRPVTEPRTPTERPTFADNDSSPLVLVSALRVDEATGHDRPSGILPRRIERDAEEMARSADDEQSFADFAESMGATELPDLLEAAAAYSAFVEGRREFSRPQLMRRVANFEQDGFTREAGLRSFGQLLRQGKIQKLKRGQFTVTERCRFNPEARFAGE